MGPHHGSVPGLSPREPGFDPKSDPVEFVVDKVPFRQVILPGVMFCPVSIIPPFLNIYTAITDTLWSSATDSVVK